MFFIGLIVAGAAMALMKGVEAAGHVAEQEVLKRRVVERAAKLGLREDYEMFELYLPPEFDSRLDAIVDGRLTSKEERLMVNALFKDLSFGAALAEGSVQKRFVLFNRGENPIRALEEAWTGLVNALDGSDEELLRAQQAVSSAANNLKGRLV